MVSREAVPFILNLKFINKTGSRLAPLFLFFNSCCVLSIYLLADFINLIVADLINLLV